jgi:SOS-response transcriptional repressor LexA
MHERESMNTALQQVLDAREQRVERARKALKEATKRHGELRAIANECRVVSENLLGQFRRGDSGLSTERLHAVETALRARGFLQPPKAQHVYQDGPSHAVVAPSFPDAGPVCAGTGTQINETIFADQYERHVPAFGPGHFAKGPAAKRLFVLTVTGDSMEPGYVEGDLVVVEWTNERERMRHRDHVVVETPSDGLLLREWFEPTKTLEPLNRQKYDPMVWPAHARLRGIVQGLVRKIR